jgi:hypothetical protein
VKLTSNQVSEIPIKQELEATRSSKEQKAEVENRLLSELRSVYTKWLDHRNISDANRWNCERGFDTLINNIIKCSDEVKE